MFPELEDDATWVTISAACARLEFQGCSPDYIRDVCHGRCCWTTGPGGKPINATFVEEDQRAEILARGVGIGPDGVMATSACGKCPFQGEEGLCKVHQARSPMGLEVKPRSCYISPWQLSSAGGVPGAGSKLIVRNRYKRLICYKAEPRLPAYRAFYSGLVMLFGSEWAARIADHFDNGGGDLNAPLLPGRLALLRHIRTAFSGWQNNELNVITPVEQYGDTWAKRDDFAANGLGAKARAISVMIADAKPSRVVTVGSRHSVQIVAAAVICHRLGLQLTAHVPGAKERTAELSYAATLGCMIAEHSPGYMSVCKKRATDDADRDGALLIPFGLTCQRAVDLVAAQTVNLPPGIKRIVVVGGSGTTAAGILAGTVLRGLPVLVVEVGADTNKAIDKFAHDQRARIETVRPTSPYERAADNATWNGIAADQYYEAKCLPYLQAGDLFWLTGHRDKLKEAVSNEQPV